MSVLIEGMQMPEKCGLCDLFHAESPMHCTVVKGHKTVGAPYGMPRPDWCPLVEVPTPVSDLIDRQAAIDAIRASTSKYTGFMEMEMYTVDDAITAVNTVPSAEPVRHGKWREYPISDGMNQCSKCGVLRFGKSNYCPNCGCRMDEE